MIMAACVDDLDVRHLRTRLRPIHRLLRQAVTRQVELAARLDRPDLASVCVTDRQVADLLDDTERLLDEDGGEVAMTSPNAAESRAEAAHREQARLRGRPLPLDRLQESVGLSAFELEALLVCAAAELDRSFERIFAYILDDMTRVHPCVQLIAELAPAGVAARLARARKLGRFGRLRRTGLLESFGEATTEARTNLRLGPGVLDFLSGGCFDALSAWVDPLDVPITDAPRPDGRIATLAAELASGRLGVVGLWARPAARAEEEAAILAAAAGRRLERFDVEAVAANPTAAVREAILAASARGAVLHVAVDPLREPDKRRLAESLAEALARTSLPCVLTGAEPWRPSALLAARSYAELELQAANFAERRSLWAEAIPDAEPGQADDLAARFRMSRLEMGAVARLAKTRARLLGNGKPASLGASIEAACSAVSRASGSRLLTEVIPRRGPDDLILAPEPFARVMEIARFSRALPRVAENWGFGRLVTGGSGLKALFTGDPGTGKTLAAEVVAGVLSVRLLKVNIAQTVSKWIGETEKNLEEAFAQARASHSVLFLDEADALCGRRGEVRHGSDRYANTEVAHLLQLIEDHDGLVVFATNLRENLDPAFLRRFQCVVQFPRPDESNRGRLWRIAFPPEAPLDGGVDLDVLARLDMTGAGIVGAAKLAALIAADEASSRIRMSHVVRGVVRQYRREGRVLTPSELGAHASLLRDA